MFKQNFKGNINEKGLSGLENKTYFMLILSRQEKILNLRNGFHIKKNEMLSFATASIDLEGIVLSEIS